MHPFFQRLFAFDAWANRETLRSLKTSPVITQRAVDLLGHILLTEKYVWEVVNGHDPTYLWNARNPDLAECERMIDDLGLRWPNFLHDHTEETLARTIDYMNSAGQHVQQTVSDLLTHAVNHSTYHRGQIATQVRNAGGEPAKTDFTIWTREIKR